MTYEENLTYIRRAGIHDLEFFCALGAHRGGYGLQQRPEEFAHFLTYMQGFPQPKNYLELGGASGGFIRAMYERLGFEHAVSIDIGTTFESALFSLNTQNFADRVERHILDSHSAAVRTILAGRKFDLIFVDGDHEYEGVQQDIDLAISCATPETRICFHDIACQHVPGVGLAYAEAVYHEKLREEIRWIEPSAGLTFGIVIARLP